MTTYHPYTSSRGSSHHAHGSDHLFERSRSRDDSRNHAKVNNHNGHVLSSSHSHKKAPINERIKPEGSYKPNEKPLDKKNEVKIKPKIIALDNAVKPIDPRKVAIERLFTRKMEKNQYFKLNLVLDIDETLVSSLVTPQEMNFARNVINNQSQKVSYSNVRVRLNANEEACQILVLFRPKLKFFLENISRYFNIYVYSHGMTKYVIEILNSIDPYSKIINRQNIIATDNKQQITDNTRKCLSRLKLDDKENLKKTLIIDDILNVWMENYSQNVIISKKYVPFYDISDNRNKNQGYHVIYDQTIKQYICFAPTNTDYYIDKSLNENSGINQLEKLTNKLIDISCNYNKNLMFFNDREILDVAWLLEKELQKILSGMRLAVSEFPTLGRPHMNIQFLTKNLIERMGGVQVAQTEILKDLNVKFLIVDKDNVEKSKVIVEEILKMIKEAKEVRQKEIEIIDNKWITDCYFNMSWIDPMKYKAVLTF